MTKSRKNISKWIFIGMTILTIAWNIVLNIVILPNYFLKTDVEVISIHSQEPSLSRGGRQINNFPTYKYVDDKGETRIFASKDGYNWINGIFFKKKVGDKITGYYEKGSRGGLFITRTGDWWTFRLMPIIIILFIFGLPMLIIFIISKYSNYRQKTIIKNLFN